MFVSLIESINKKVGGEMDLVVLALPQSFGEKSCSFCDIVCKCVCGIVCKCDCHGDRRFFHVKTSDRNKFMSVVSINNIYRFYITIYNIFTVICLHCDELIQLRFIPWWLLWGFLSSVQTALRNMEIVNRTLPPMRFELVTSGYRVMVHVTSITAVYFVHPVIRKTWNFQNMQWPPPW